MDDRLRPLWDFSDLDASEARLRTQLEAEDTESGRAEVETQLARVHGLRGHFDEGDALLDEAASRRELDGVTLARIPLERGRLRRSSGDPESARPLFEAAYAGALAAQQYFLAADAAHMVALVAGDHEGFVDWTRRGIELAERHEPASYWLGPLLNNLGWEHYEAGELESALGAFERALAARECDPANADGIELALYAVGKARRGLGRSADAVPLLERALASAAARGHADGWYHEELAEEYAAIGREGDAGEQARFAIPLLERDDPSFADDAARRRRLAALTAL
jgi:tetratricopeptide (TPR) repeat protein